MKRISLLAICAGVMFTGCIESTTLLTVNRDGSGQILQRTFMTQQAKGMMAMAAMSQGQQDGEDKMPSINLSSNELKAAADRMGEGVSFVKSRKLNKENGSEGSEALFTFKDITKLKFDMNQAVSGGAQQGGTETRSASRKIPAFAFAKGATPTLTITLPAEAIESPSALGGRETPDDPASKAMMQQMMKTMLAGARISVLLDVTGQITDSDATYVSKSAISKFKNRITLMDVDLDKIMANPRGFELMDQLSDKTKSKAALDSIAKEIEGIKIENKDKIFVTFR